MVGTWINLYPGEDSSGWLRSQGTIKGEEPGRGNVTNRAGEKHSLLESELLGDSFSLLGFTRIQGDRGGILLDSV